MYIYLGYGHVNKITELTPQFLSIIIIINLIIPYGSLVMAN